MCVKINRGERGVCVWGEVRTHRKGEKKEIGKEIKI